MTHIFLARWFDGDAGEVVTFGVQPVICSCSSPAAMYSQDSAPDVWPAESSVPLKIDFFWTVLEGLTWVFAIDDQR